MIRMRKSMTVRVLKPLSTMVLLLMIFGLVWLRSTVVSLEYGLCQMEQKKIELEKEKKLLAAEKARLASAERLGQAANAEFVFPDRVKVLAVVRGAEEGTYKVSYSAARQKKAPAASGAWRN
jgi:anaerobic C4-dicarboxylate transporter